MTPMPHRPFRRRPWRVVAPWAIGLACLACLAPRPGRAAEVAYFQVPAGSHPHDVAPAADGGVWFTAQHSGHLGRLDPSTGRTEMIPLGRGAAPHGVAIGPDGAPWITDGGRNAILRVDPISRVVRVFPLPAGTPYANLNTLAFDRAGRVWFTGQEGYYGSVDMASGAVRVWPAPRGRGPYGIAATPSGEIFYASLAGHHIAHIDPRSGRATVIEPPDPGQGARRIWSDSRGRLWVSEWVSGLVAAYDPGDGRWKRWKPPGESPHTYSVCVDDRDRVWISEWTSNAILRLDPDSGRFEAFPSDREGAAVRQMAARGGEVWGAESGTDRLVVVRDH
jgi:virginiamycin B lyase